MKLILSRKGFDSSAGGGPSPILPDGTLLSLPIPSADALHWRSLRGPGGRTLAAWMGELGIGAVERAAGCHADPDLDPGSRPRRPGWRPAFGTDGAAAGHLRDQGVGAGDLFAFFGWFRPTGYRRGRLRFLPGPDLHVIFGFLQVDRVWHPAQERLPAWLADHPHAGVLRRRRPGNRIFTARRELSLASGRATELPGAGLLAYHPRRVLTRPGRSRSCWDLPRSVFGDREISYHRPAAWRQDGFRAASRGQEFVLEASSAVARWIGQCLAAPADSGAGRRSHGNVGTLR